ncbi:hypothetical protein P153DRAFT_368038 [Dothidotthia symphoricarpi CBS 119687]|uniref:Uncharacterized protein n=1 Tax=Dothidotthia symphoricarpi CBS 119687 TaxID=1392245 RepID=A0A6A6A8H3_9PLEO|nr:uncharacterized protein P153DRAFT_368038 [Dothidotthia symphoricarpi CBS 119687]KAF2128159.1 hypothetical protein P153DRAFT_368038 [Dothidotthia symphoricarpi CBS 119687]
MCGPDQTYRGLCGSVNAHTVVPFIPPNQILHSYCPEVFASSLSRHSLPRESYGPYYLPVYPYALPPNHLYSGSLPPAGLYSVPEKPRSSAPPSKSSQTSLPLDLRPTHATVSQPSILISRLVILGKHGVTLIDHWWPIPQRIGTQQTASVVYDSVDELLVGYREFLRSGAHSQRLRRRSRSPEKMGTLLTRSSIKNAISSSVCLSPDKRKRDSTHNGQMIPAHLSAGVETEPLALVEKHESETEGVQSRVQGESMRCLVSNRSTLYPRRTSLRNSILGVQGPKAATYAFEDPEEVLRQAKRLRRSRSPKKLCPVTSHSHCPIATPLADNLLNVSKKTTSSPLSSVPSTPEPEPENVIQDNIQRRSSLRRLTNPFAQVDGSPERRNPTRSPPKTRTPAVTSPRKLNNPSASESIATPARQLQSQFPDTPQSSPLFDARKRKFTKEPPSSDRFKTADNPPLNRDCVIAFAESEDKENASCILRQIKGERQGLFHEEYVVLASRFFVAVE